jgi:hypothetical protein
MRIQRERVKLLRQKQARERKKAGSESQENPPLPPMSEEEKERCFDQIFGTLYPDPLAGGKSLFDEEPEEAASVPAVQSAAIAPVEVKAVAPPPDQEESKSPEPDLEALKLQQIMELANKGDAYGSHCMGVRYRDGFGVPKDLVKARHWLEKAAAQGSGGAKIALHALNMRPFNLVAVGEVTENHSRTLL